ncbi:MAG: 4Fe-4S dicluster domain-containing protein [Methanomassiliicoccales archaeon]
MKSYPLVGDTLVVGVVQEICQGCGACVSSCPSNAIVMKGKKAAVTKIFCRSCGVCLDNCPAGALQMHDC